MVSLLPSRQLAMPMQKEMSLTFVGPHAPPLARIKVPPIKSQGIKTKLARFIVESIKWQADGCWVEPFVGSAAVVLNAAPARALLTDINVHVIRFYRDIASGKVTPDTVRTFLEQHGRILAQKGGEYYYEMRDAFNTNPTSHAFLFLNRSGFNGLIRFNSKGELNVPFGRKPNRFRPAYVTKTVNQVAYLAKAIRSHEWVFDVADWRDTLAKVGENDFVYADPPYMGRHTDYFNSWTETDAMELFERLDHLPCGFALSTWKANLYRTNPLLPESSPNIVIRTFSHFYHVGSTEDLRHPIQEALVIKQGFETPLNGLVSTLSSR